MRAQLSARLRHDPQVPSTPHFVCVWLKLPFDGLLFSLFLIYRSRHDHGREKAPTRRAGFWGVKRRWVSLIALVDLRTLGV